MYFEDLDEQQRENLVNILDYANTYELNSLTTLYPEIIKKHKLELYRINVIHHLMHNTIPIETIYGQLCKFHFNRANTIIHFEYNKAANNNNFFNPHTEEILQGGKKHLLSFTEESLNKVTIIDFDYNEDELNLSLVLPATYIQKQTNLNGEKIQINKSKFYFAYIWINSIDGSVTFSLPKFEGYSSINGIGNSRNFLTATIKTLEKLIEDLFGKLNLTDSSWVTAALRRITTKYYSHNNPEIDKQMSLVRQSMKQIEINDTEKIELTQQLKYLSSYINNDISIKRIQKSLESAIEKELIFSLGLLPAEHPFEVYLHNVNRGPTAFQSRKSISNGDSTLPQIDTRDIIMNMLEYSSINSIGLKYREGQLCIAYNISSTSTYFILEQTNNTNTPKELVKNVLSEFKRYKQEDPSQSKRTTNTND